MRTSSVHIVTRRRLKVFWEAHPDAETSLKAWFRIVRQASWRHIADVRRVFPHADAAGLLTVFNIGGNKYRLMTRIDYETGKVFIRSVLIHAEYSRGKET